MEEQDEPGEERCYKIGEGVRHCSLGEGVPCRSLGEGALSHSLEEGVPCRNFEGARHNPEGARHTDSENKGVAGSLEEVVDKGRPASMGRSARMRHLGGVARVHSADIARIAAEAAGNHCIQGWEGDWHTGRASHPFSLRNSTWYGDRG